MAIVMNRRGQIFTLVFLLLLTFLFVSFEIYTFIAENNSVKTRIDSMNSFLDAIEKNLEGQLYVIGFRVIFLAETEITNTGTYISDFDAFFDEAFFNGTVNGVPNNTYLSGATYNDLITLVNDKSSKVNLQISIRNSNVTIYQDDPWHVSVTMVSDFVMTDNSGLANWSKKQNITARIPIEGFEDPFYTINSNAKVIRKIYATPYEGQYASGTNVSNLSDHVSQDYYAASASAPSFLQRLEGNFSASSQGIESFVDVTDFSNQGLLVEEKTRIDYIYFSANNPTFYTVSGMQSWFRIDNESNHLALYNVSGLAS